MEYFTFFEIFLFFIIIMLESIALAFICLIAFAIILPLPYLFVKLIIKLVSLINKKNIANFINCISAEWIFNYFPNGGTAAALRTLLVGTTICISIYASHMILIKEFVPLPPIIDYNIYKILSIYAAVYAAFYARFVSQWTYLSNLYNTLRDQEINLSPSSAAAMQNKLSERKAEFIFDAINLHLDSKPAFASKIYLWLTQDTKVMENFLTLHPKGLDDIYKANKEFKVLLNRITRSINDYSHD